VEAMPVTPLFFEWEMLLAFRLTKSAYYALPSAERKEMRRFFAWRSQREHLITQARMQEAKSRGKR